jgi:Tfp pilus assembly protein PilF
LERALEIKGDKTSALSVMGDIYRDQGDDEKAQEYYERCYNVFMRKWKNDALNEVDYGWFEDVARKLGRYDMAAKIANDRPTKAQSRNYNAENLVTLQKKNKGEEDEE